MQQWCCRGCVGVAAAMAEVRDAGLLIVCGVLCCCAAVRAVLHYCFCGCMWKVVHRCRRVAAMSCVVVCCVRLWNWVRMPFRMVSACKWVGMPQGCLICAHMWVAVPAGD